MPKFKFFNDTKRPIRIHPATWYYCTSDNKESIQPLEVRTFEYSNHKEHCPMIKQWSDGTIAILLVEENE